MEEPVLFGDFFGVNEGHAGRVYKPISDLNKLAQIMEEFRMRQTMGGGEQVRSNNMSLLIIHVEKYTWR